MERRGGTHCRRFRVPDGIGDILFRLARTRAGGTRWSPDGLVRSNVNRRALHPTTALRLSDRLSESLPCLCTDMVAMLGVTGRSAVRAPKGSIHAVNDIMAAGYNVHRTEGTRTKDE